LSSETAVRPLMYVYTPLYERQVTRMEDVMTTIDAPLARRDRKGLGTKLASLAAAIAVATAASPAGAEELRPIQAKSLPLGDVNGIAYYTVQGEAYHVIATLGGAGQTPVRFESALLPGQTIVLSIPGNAAGEARTIAFLRQGDRLLVETSPVQAKAGDRVDAHTPAPAPRS
jgi:hypothetical protein